MATMIHGAFTVIMLILGLGMVVDAVSVQHDNSTWASTDKAQMKSSIKGIHPFVYLQPLDHFVYGLPNVTTFPQRYYVDDRFWSGPTAGGPIFVYFGGEFPIDDMPGNVGLLNDCAPHFQALVIYIEHRFYGKSVPLGSIDLAMASPEIRNCLTTKQVLMDYAEIIISVKDRLLATNSVVIVVGGSYAGILSAWFRLKYPHIATGALASSAPILSYDGITPEDAACEVVSNDFKELDENCYNTIRRSWSTIDDIASVESGLEYLSRSFNTCRPLQSSTTLKSYLSDLYTVAAQYNGRFNTFIKSVCDAIQEETDPIKGMVKVIAVVVGTNKPCLEIRGDGDYRPFNIDMNSIKAWKWQQCTELVAPKGCSQDSMLPPSHFDFTTYSQACQRRYAVLPRPHWVADYYGGRQDMATTLQHFGSNIIFSNGLRDPFSSGGVLKDISSTIVAITTKEGSHCLDLTSSPDDPKWLVHQRQKEMKIFARWIAGAHSGFKFSQPSYMVVVFSLLVSIVIICT